MGVLSCWSSPEPRGGASHLHPRLRGKEQPLPSFTHPVPPPLGVGGSLLGGTGECGLLAEGGRLGLGMS